jgi:hypothetical protein
VTLPTDGKLPAHRPAVTDQGTARQLLEFAGASLPQQQKTAIELWAQSHGFDEIRAALSLPTARDAERLVRAGLERLRRQFPRDS